jgi:ribose-phosphate pyrophosphokinase
LGVALAKAKIEKFADGEENIQIMDNVRGRHVFIVQPTCTPVNDNLMELLLLISTARRSSAKEVTAVIPYYGYARQDRKTASRVPISAADVAKLLEAVGLDRMISVDLHCGQIQGFFGPRTPVDNLDGSMTLITYAMGKKGFFQNSPNLTVVSPDAGGVQRAKKFQERMVVRGFPNTRLAMIIKHRTGPSQIGSMYLVGTVQGRDCVIIDDMIDTAVNEKIISIITKFRAQSWKLRKN